MTRDEREVARDAAVLRIQMNSDLTGDQDYEILENLWDTCLTTMCGYTNRTPDEIDEECCAVIEKATVKAYERLGESGTKSYSAGSQSWNFEDIDEWMFNEVIKQSLRYMQC